MVVLLLVVLLVVLRVFHDDRPVGRDALGASAGHAAAAIWALYFGHGAQRGRVGLRRCHVAVLRLDVLDPHGLGALHRLLRVPALTLLPGRRVLLQSVLLLLHGVLLFEPSSSAQEASVLEHVVRVWVQRPVAPLAGFLVIAGNFDKTLVQRQVVSDAVLPALLVVAIKREPLHDELINPVEGHLLVRRVLDSHGDERDVAVRGFHHILGLGLRRVRSIRPRHARWVLIVGRVRVHVHRCGHPGVPATRSGPVVARVAADVGHDAQGVGTGDGVASLHVCTASAVRLGSEEKSAPKNMQPETSTYSFSPNADQKSQPLSSHF